MIDGFNTIVVADRGWGIGRANKLLVHLPGDLRYFKEKTLGKVLIMGRKTLESLPGGKPLQGRDTVIMTRDLSYETKIEKSDNGRVFVCHSVNELEELIGSSKFGRQVKPSDVFVTGGSSIYEEFMPWCNKFYVTKINERFEADSYFPDLDEMVLKGELKLTWESEVQDEKGIAYQFMVYSR